MFGRESHHTGGRSCLTASCRMRERGSEGERETEGEGEGERASIRGPTDGLLGKGGGEQEIAQEGMMEG